MTMFDDSEQRKKAIKNFPAVLDGMSVVELQAYIDELQAEIARVQADMQRKKDSQDAASSIFKF